jgi:hypothetical protein
MFSPIRFSAAKLAFLLIFFLTASAAAVADTIRLKDGSVIKGKVTDFKNGQFTVVRTTAGNRTSQMTIFAEEVESIEFDTVTITNQTAAAPAPPSASDSAPIVNGGKNGGAIVVGSAGNSNTTLRPPSVSNSGGSLSSVINSQPAASNVPRSPNGRFVSVPVKVLADDTANGWTNSGVVVKKGQRIRISAIGRISLGAGKYSTPAGVGSLPDSDKLMKNEPTGALIAVIGDDNNDFIFVGSQVEFVAARDGTLFLGVNEGKLDDNSGAFDAVVELDASDATAQK